MTHQIKLVLLLLFSFTLVKCLIVNRAITRFEREYWMRQALREALIAGQPEGNFNPCPFGPFGAVIVNHSITFNPTAHPFDPNVGIHRQLTCRGVSQGGVSDPTGHGELEAIRNCARQYPGNGFNFGGFWQYLSVYSTAEPCPMCQGAVRWARVGEVVWSTSIPTLLTQNRSQIRIRASEVNFQSARDQHPLWRFTSNETGEFLTGLTENLFNWQFDGSVPCPNGCYRSTVIGGPGIPLCLPNQPPVTPAPAAPTVVYDHRTLPILADPPYIYIKVEGDYNIRTVESDCGNGYIHAVKVTGGLFPNNLWKFDATGCSSDRYFSVVVNLVEYFYFGLQASII